MAAVDTFTRTRLVKFLASFKVEHGRDASERDLESAGFAPDLVAKLVREGAVTKYQVTSGAGSRENRFKLAQDPDSWRRK